MKKTDRRRDLKAYMHNPVITLKGNKVSAAQFMSMASELQRGVAVFEPSPPATYTLLGTPKSKRIFKYHLKRQS